MKKPLEETVKHMATIKVAISVLAFLKRSETK
jgi:hypothetical protein